VHCKVAGILTNEWEENDDMGKMELTDRIEVNPAICGGKPVIRGTRIMVRNILGMVAGGYGIDKVLASYPDLTREDVTAALEYAAQVVDEDQVIAH
jgi:uncharacterized protein (DUF433 family)